MHSSAQPDSQGEIDPIDRLVEEARAALQQNMFAVSLMTTMALVDICGALGSENGRSNGAKFRAWFSAHVPSEHAAFDAEDAWELRCGLLHQGHTHGRQYDAILFTLPEPNGNVFHDNSFENIGGESQRVLNVDLTTFVNGLLSAVSNWWLDNKSLQVVSDNARSLARIRMNGLRPYMVGMPLIA